MTPEVLVTVCITTYNRYSVIDTLRSVQRQSYKNIEILVVDDCSRLGPIEELYGIATIDDRLQIIQHDENKGLAAARNTAIKSAKGKFFTFVDDDDLWEEDYIKTFVEVAKNSSTNYCFCCGPKVLKNNITFCFIPRFSDTLENIIYKGYTPPISGQFYFLSSLLKVQGYNESLKSGIDHDLWLKLAAAGLNIRGVEKCLVRPNKDVSIHRMTTDSENRINNIRHSLRIWEPLLVKNFKPGFNNHFKLCYEYFNFKSFFYQSIKRRSFSSAYFYFKNCPKKMHLLFDIMNKSLSLFLSRGGVRSWKPLFMPFKHSK